MDMVLVTGGINADPVLKIGRFPELAKPLFSARLPAAKLSPSALAQASLIAWEGKDRFGQTLLTEQLKGEGIDAALNKTNSNRTLFSVARNRP